MSNTDTDQPHITAVRAQLLATMEALRAGTLSVDSARAVAEVARAIVDTAKVEVDYLRVTGGDGESPFLHSADKPALEQPEPGRTVHRLR